MFVRYLAVHVISTNHIQISLSVFAGFDNHFFGAKRLIDMRQPLSKVLAKGHPTLKVTANATITCTGLSILYGLIYIASTTACNSIISIAILSLNITYLISKP